MSATGRFEVDCGRSGDPTHDDRRSGKAAGHRCQTSFRHPEVHAVPIGEGTRQRSGGRVACGRDPLAWSGGSRCRAGPDGCPVGVACRTGERGDADQRQLVGFQQRGQRDQRHLLVLVYRGDDGHDQDDHVRRVRHWPRRNTRDRQELRYRGRFGRPFQPDDHLHRDLSGVGVSRNSDLLRVLGPHQQCHNGRVHHDDHHPDVAARHDRHRDLADGHARIE